jgi:plasmid stabilization system protein ParE
MPASGLELHPEALDEALAGYAWYLERSERAADAFFADLERAVELIIDRPEAWPRFLHGTRRFILTKFPYSIVYGQVGDAVVIYAFAHAKRRPGYWKARLR